MIKQHSWKQLENTLGELNLPGECNCYHCDIVVEKYKCIVCGCIKLYVTTNKLTRYHVSKNKIPYNHEISCADVLMETIME